VRRLRGRFAPQAKPPIARRAFCFLRAVLRPLHGSFFQGLH
jgi:hypothetical protein